MALEELCDLMCGGLDEEQEDEEDGLDNYQRLRFGWRRKIIRR